MSPISPPSPTLVIGTNFAPRTTIAGLQAAMPLPGGRVHLCYVQPWSESVIAEILFDDRSTAETFIAVMNRLNSQVDESLQIALRIQGDPMSLIDCEEGETTCWIPTLQPARARPVVEKLEAEEHEGVDLIDFQDRAEPPRLRGVEWKSVEVEVSTPLRPPKQSLLDDTLAEKAEQRHMRRIEQNLADIGVLTPWRMPGQPPLLDGTFAKVAEQVSLQAVAPKLAKVEALPQLRTSDQSLVDVNFADQTEHMPLEAVDHEPIIEFPRPPGLPPGPPLDSVGSEQLRVPVEIGINMHQPAPNRLKFDISIEPVAETLAIFCEEFHEKVAALIDADIRERLQARQPDIQHDRQPSPTELRSTYFEGEWGHLQTAMEAGHDWPWGKAIMFRSVDSQNQPQQHPERPVSVTVSGHGLKAHLLRYSCKGLSIDQGLIREYVKIFLSRKPSKLERQRHAAARVAKPNPGAKGLAAQPAHVGKRPLQQLPVKGNLLEFADDEDEDGQGDVLDEVALRRRRRNRMKRKKAVKSKKRKKLEAVGQMARPDEGGDVEAFEAAAVEQCFGYSADALLSSILREEPEERTVPTVPDVPVFGRGLEGVKW